MENTTETSQTKLPMMAGYTCIVDDGDCTDHGYSLPKLPTKRRVVSEGMGVVGLVHMTNEELQSILASASKAQVLMLRQVGL